MEVYKIRKWGDRPETNIKKDWCTTIDNQGRLKYFMRGKGYRRTTAYKLIDLPIDEHKKDGLYIGEIANKYGYNIAVEVCETAFGCCLISAEHWVGTFKLAYDTAVANFTESEIAQISRELVNMLRPMAFLPLPDLCSLDRFMRENDKEYNGENCTYKGKENVSMEAYITEKYGKLTAKLISKMLE